MSYSGMPTPDETLPQTFRCVQVFIPDCVGDVFFSVIIGQMTEMAQSGYWKQEGDMSPETAAFLMAQAVAMTDADGLSCEDIMACENVADCIDNDVTVQLALNTTIINAGIVNSNVINSNVTILTDRIPDPEVQEIAETGSDPCDLDAIWAGIRSMVERIDGNGRDILEDLSVINDKIEQWAELIDLVPILGDTIKDISDLFTEQLPDILNQYNSASSPTFLDNVACDLFSMVCNDCRYPTFDEILNYFGSHSYVALPNMNTVTYGTIWDIVKAVPLLVPEPLWYTINAWQCLTLAFDGLFNRSYGKKSFEIWASFGEDNPNDNWIILCDGCPEPAYEITFDFTLGSAVPPNSMNAGTYSSGSGWWQGSNLANDRLVYWSIPTGIGLVHNEIEIDYKMGGGIGNDTAYINMQGALGNTHLNYVTDWTVESVPINDNAGSLVKTVATNNRLTYNTQIYVRRLTLRGHGYVPASLVPYMVYGEPA